jgi:O-antigen/teichoic acid export membrane protein
MSATTDSAPKVLVRGLASAWTSALVATICSLWLAPFALSRLNPTEYAIFLLANDVLLWLAFLDFGLTGALTAKLAPHGSGPSDNRDRIASTGFAAQSAIATLTLATGLTLAWLFTSLFPVPPHLHAEVRLVVGLLSVATALSAATKTYNAVLIANRRLYLNHLNQTLSVLLRTVLVASGLALGWGLPSLAYGALFAAALTSLQARRMVKQDLPHVRLSWSLADRGTLADIGSTGIWFALSGLAVIALRTSDRFMVAHLMALSSVTSYALTGRIYEICHTNLSQITNTTWPMLAELHGQGKRQEAWVLWRGTSTLSVVAPIIVGFSVWASNGVFVRAWVGSQHYGGIALDSILMANMCLLIGIMALRSALTGAQVVRPQAIWRVGEGVVFITLALQFVPSLGLVGVATAKLLSTFVGCLWMPSRVANLLGMPVSMVLRHLVGSSLRSALLLLPVALAGRWVAEQGEGYVLAGVVFLSVIGLSLVIALRWGIRSHEQDALRVWIERLPQGQLLSRLLLPSPSTC